MEKQTGTEAIRKQRQECKGCSVKEALTFSYLDLFVTEPSTYPII